MDRHRGYGRRARAHSAQRHEHRVTCTESVHRSSRLDPLYRQDPRHRHQQAGVDHQMAQGEQESGHQRPATNDDRGTHTGLVCRPRHQPKRPEMRSVVPRSLPRLFPLQDARHRNGSVWNRARRTHSSLLRRDRRPEASLRLQRRYAEQERVCDDDSDRGKDGCRYAPTVEASITSRTLRKPERPRQTRSMAGSRRSSL